MPSSIFEIIISMVIMASSTRSPSAMMSAPSEMRCRLMPIASMATKTMASTSGMDSATTSPALKPRLRKLTTSTMPIASKSAFGELADGLAHDLGLVRHEVELDADREALLQAFGRLVQAFAEGEIVAALAHVDADADGGLAVDAEHLGRRVAIAALHLGDVRKACRSAHRPTG